MVKRGLRFPKRFRRGVLKIGGAGGFQGSGFRRPSSKTPNPTLGRMGGKAPGLQGLETQGYESPDFADGFESCWNKSVGLVTFHGVGKQVLA